MSHLLVGKPFSRLDQVTRQLLWAPTETPKFTTLIYQQHITIEKSVAVICLHIVMRLKTHLPEEKLNVSTVTEKIALHLWPQGSEK